MGHCVGDYTWWGIRGWSSIWSVRSRKGNRLRRVLTLELALPSGNGMQIRGRHNQMPTDAQMAIVRRWASIAGVLVVRR